MNKKRIFFITLFIISFIIIYLILIKKTFYLILIQQFSIMCLYAISYNLMLGQLGLASFGHGGLIGIGAYGFTIFINKLNINFGVSFILAPILTGICAWIIGYLSLKSKGAYFSFITLAFGQLIWAVIWKWRNLTGGDDGIVGLKNLPKFLNNEINIFIMIILVSFVLIIIIKIILLNSYFGFTLKIIRENSKRAEMIGVDIKKYQLLAFFFSGLFTGFAGCLYSIHSQGAFVEMASISKSFEPVWCCLIGGMYKFIGPIIGAGIMMFLDYFVAAVTKYWHLFAGIILIFTVLYMPEGIIEGVKKVIKNEQ
jgi:branched-chain amino acid transport system permease protein